MIKIDHDELEWSEIPAKCLLSGEGRFQLQREYTIEEARRLKDAVLGNGGLHEPVYVAEQTFEVIDGRERLRAYAALKAEGRSLRRVTVRVIPDATPERVLRLLLQNNAPSRNAKVNDQRYYCKKAIHLWGGLTGRELEQLTGLNRTYACHLKNDFKAASLPAKDKALEALPKQVVARKTKPKKSKRPAYRDQSIDLIIFDSQKGTKPTEWEALSRNWCRSLRSKGKILVRCRISELTAAIRALGYDYMVVSEYLTLEDGEKPVRYLLFRAGLLPPIKAFYKLLPEHEPLDRPFSSRNELNLDVVKDVLREDGNYNILDYCGTWSKELAALTANATLPALQPEGPAAGSVWTYSRKTFSLLDLMREISEAAPETVPDTGIAPDDPDSEEDDFFDTPKEEYPMLSLWDARSKAKRKHSGSKRMHALEEDSPGSQEPVQGVDATRSESEEAET